MRFFLPLKAVTGSGNSLEITQVRGDYYGPMYFHVRKPVGGNDATCNVFAGEGARAHAINDTTSARAGTLVVPNATAAWKDITNKTAGPNLANMDVHCAASGTFTSAIRAYSEEVEFELAERMKATLKNYCKADELLRDEGFGPDNIEIGLADNMPGHDRKIGIILMDSPEMLRSEMGFQIELPRFQWTVWLQDHESPEATSKLAYRMLGRFRSIAFDEQRTWGGLCLNTANLGRLTPRFWLEKKKGTPTRFGLKVLIQMTCHCHGGHEHEDPIWPTSTSVRGGRYAVVDLSQA